jgi:hypothetical protein
MVRDAGIETKGIICNETNQILACAVDVILVGKITDILKEAVVNFSEATKEMGLNNRSVKKLRTRM